MQRIFYFLLIAVLIACSQDPKPTHIVHDQETDVPVTVNKDTISMNFRLGGAPDTVDNGEEIKRYKNGVTEMRGMRKDSQRTGLWKSWYEDGTPWSETTFENGKKNGRTVTWYENGKKRYEGYYTNDAESGKWIYYDEQGNVTGTKDFGNK